LAVITKKDAKGGFKVLIADAEGKYSKETISKIKFKYREIVESGPPKLG